MTFNNITESKDYFQTLEEAIQQRQSLWSKNSKILESLKQDLSDYIDVEEIYVINEFMEKNLHTINGIDILIELSTLQFEQLLEEKILDGYNIDNINFYFKTDKESYLKTEDFYKKENLVIKCRQIV